MISSTLLSIFLSLVIISVNADLQTGEPKCSKTVTVTEYLHKTLYKWPGTAPYREHGLHGVGSAPPYPFTVTKTAYETVQGSPTTIYLTKTIGNDPDPYPTASVYRKPAHRRRAAPDRILYAQEFV